MVPGTSWPRATWVRGHVALDLRCLPLSLGRFPFLRPHFRPHQHFHTRPHFHPHQHFHPHHNKSVEYFKIQYPLPEPPSSPANYEKVNLTKSRRIWNLKANEKKTNFKVKEEMKAAMKERPELISGWEIHYIFKYEWICRYCPSTQSIIQTVQLAKWNTG